MRPRWVFAALMFPAVYGLGAFIAWDFNPGEWDIFGRGTLAFIATWAALGLVILE